MASLLDALNLEGDGVILPGLGGSVPEGNYTVRVIASQGDFLQDGHPALDDDSQGNTLRRSEPFSPEYLDVLANVLDGDSEDDSDDEYPEEVPPTYEDATEGLPPYDAIAGEWLTFVNPNGVHFL